jgi:phage major head subunit gpT-like protein
MKLDAQTLAAVNRGFKAVFQQAFDGVEPTWNQVAMEVPSETSEEQYGWLSSIPQFREWIGPRVVQNLATSDFMIKNKKFENTIGVKQDDISDDKIGVYRPLVAQLGQSAKLHPDLLVYSLMKTGFSAVCYDGQYMFDTDHPGYDQSGAAVSWSNVQSGSGEPWFLIASRGIIKPFIYQKRQDYRFVAKNQPNDDNMFFEGEAIYGVDGRCNVGFGLPQLVYAGKGTLDATTYATGRAQLAKQFNPGGQPLGVVPDLLVTGPANEAAAKNLLQAEYLAAGATNIWKGTAKHLMTPWLAS